MEGLGTGIGGVGGGKLQIVHIVVPARYYI